MRSVFLGLIVVSLILVLSQPIHAAEFDCKRNQETTTGPREGTPHAIRFRVDPSKEIVVEIDGCTTRTYSNSTDVNATGFASKCPPSGDPVMKMLQHDTTPSGSFRLDRHFDRDEVFHVTVTSDSVEWGLESRGQSLALRFDKRTDVLTLDKSCHSCTAAWAWAATYQCKKAVR